VIVLADRYAFTAFARDVARGVDPQWVRSMYSFAIMPDAALYFRVPLGVAVERITGARASLKYYEAGMDLGLSENINESFELFQGRILNEYDKMVDEFGLTMIDGTKPVKEQQKRVRSIIKKILVGFDGLPNPNRMPISVTNIQAAKAKKGGSK
jgi:dTMP kinase